MKIVDKYGLALCSYGTPFYRLRDCKAYKRIDGKDIPIIPKEYDIDSGLQILTSFTFRGMWDNKPMFNGVCPVEPDEWTVEGEGFTEENIKDKKLEFYETDEDSNDYDDDDRFLVLNKKEFKELLNLLTHYYNRMEE